MHQEEMQKVTAHIPIDLLHEAQSITGKGITETLKIALGQLTRSHAYDSLRKMKGKINFSINLNSLREDRG